MKDIKTINEAQDGSNYLEQVLESDKLFLALSEYKQYIKKLKNSKLSKEFNKLKQHAIDMNDEVEKYSRELDNK